MKVRFTKAVVGVTAEPVDPEDKRRIVEGMNANGAGLEPDAPPYFAGLGAFAADCEALGLGQEHVDRLYSQGSIEADVDEWTFRHLCGYQSD